ncbi:hypothetical protein VF14_11850 [Nostoc linckia z18]|uniref:DUF1349 domain-containing protein n=3 Tax=Nostoc linckia TaxID=92942 RepID=A0A9Q5ZD72_NOSLI|nr:hypothetical protein VF02_23185 [Nostoc linckia z1]PHJ63435.1 hypothetical protein VF05_24460 [Nostoc linckia z3]PHJ70610.1 hypothetical protein VF03_21720 [Nostoc linckia z2]PHJ79750.1 hypothetical protein VF06_24840 [Nostoc linckia z4]PHJ89296.1 hypothetical protein VF07_12905 [Nostoc linckia z6]PHJ96759.1 hypothetical protein VF04_14650 [Nostoc linckia z7]PHK04221.1 hypothetical protein VF08_12370 [Nostoc linckia z8]PHK10789.1 hypothetical protein VF09_10180 [Nostoc linckia z9]PHK1344
MTVMKWYNKPQTWNIQDGTIKITSSQNTDFWRKTFHGYIRDNGHFYCKQVSGDFTAQVKISGEYKEQYDQAGLMVRLDETNWLKCGIELIDNVQHVIAVVTHDYSDVSLVPMLDNPAAIWMRVNRRGSALQVFYSLERENYTMFRMAYLTLVETVSVGIMCASPNGNGFPVNFEEFNIESHE